MKKFLLSMVALATTIAGFAQAPSITPSPGSVNTTNDELSSYSPAGLASICLNLSNGVVNRACEGIAVLSYNGTPVAALPASNTRRVYCEEGFDKHTESGDIRLDFYMGNADSSPYNKNGNYQLTIPSDFYTLNGKPNSPFTVDWTISDRASVLEVVATPANRASVESLSEVQIKFNGALGLEVENSDQIYLVYSYRGEKVGENYKETINPEIKIDGNLLTLSWPNVCDKAGNVILYITSSQASTTAPIIHGLKVLTASGSQYYENTLTYTIVGKQDDSAINLTATPAPGTYSSIPLSTFKVNDGVEVSGLFELTLPEGMTFVGYNTLSYITMQDASGKDVSTKGHLTVMNNPNTQGGNKIIITPASWGAYTKGMILPDGEYYINIPANGLSYSVNGGATQKAPNLKVGPYNFKQDGGDVPQYTITPTPDTEINELKDIVITFDEGATINWDVTIGYATMLNGITMYDIKPEIENNVITFSFPSAITTPGVYNLDIPGSLLSVNKFPIDINVDFNVVRPLSSLSLFVGEKKVETTLVENDEEDSHWFASYNFGENEAKKIRFELPEGYNELYYYDNSFINIDPLADNEVPVICYIPATELVAAGFVLAENNEVPVEIGIQRISYCYGKDGECDEPSLLEFEATGATTGVEAVEVADENAEYYTLQGIKVANPENGIYIKVQNGKVFKVLVK